MPMLTTSASFEGCSLTSRVLDGLLRVRLALVFVAPVFRDLVAAVFLEVVLLLCFFVVRFAGVTALATFFAAGFLVVALLTLVLALVVEVRVVLVFV